MKSPFATFMLVGLSAAMLTACEYGQAADDPGLVNDNVSNVQAAVSAAPAYGAQAFAKGDKPDRPRGERPGAKARFAQQDGNKDGKVTKAEAKTFHTERFASLDANKNGYIDADEMAARRWEGKGPGRGRGDGTCDRQGDGKQEGKRDGKGRPGEGPRGGFMIALMDADKDGKVSAKEFAQFHDTLFDEIDANKDGVVTEQEWLAKKPGPRAPKR